MLLADFDLDELPDDLSAVLDVSTYGVALRLRAEAGPRRAETNRERSGLVVISYEIRR
jgi:hypothetical protein